MPLDPLSVNEALVIPATELRVTTSRASGPGGQHVNRVETRVSLVFQLDASRVLPEPVKDRLRLLASHLITVDGELVVHSGRHRSQYRNLEECRTRLRGLILRALVPPKRRRRTRPPRSAVIARRRAKLHQSRKKARRRRVMDDSD